MAEKQVEGMKNCNSMVLETEPRAISVMKLPIPLKVEFADKDGVCSTKEGFVNYLKGDAIMTGTKGERWPIAKEKFEKTYEAVDAEKGLYSKKSLPVLALKIDEPFTVNVSWSKDPLVGKPGDWLLQYGKGDFGIVDAEIFKETYKAL